MPTFLQKYNAIFRTDDWKYYSGLKLDNPFDEYSIPNYFINQYFRAGGKEEVFDYRFTLDKDRNIHTISVFFLGIALRRLICGDEEYYPDFRYLWFLACLYHDYGYTIEGDKKRFNNQKFNLDKLKHKLEIKYDIFDEEIDGPFSKELITKYYDYCRKGKGFINHGIVGGLMLFDKLKKNYKKAKREAKRLNVPGVSKDDFIYKHLHWNITHSDWYKRVASIIILHNVWFCTKNKDVSLYRRYELNELNIIGKPERKLNRSGDSFLFLLLIADTIEPVKAFHNVKPRCVLNQIDINILGREISLRVNDPCINPKEWFKKIKDLETWLNVNVDDSVNNSITIQLLD